VIVALPGFFLPLLLTFGLAFWMLELPLLVSLFIGGTMTATSFGITVRVLADLNRQHSSEGQIVLNAAVLDDILGVLLLALLYEYSRSERNAYGFTDGEDRMTTPKHNGCPLETFWDAAFDDYIF